MVSRYYWDKWDSDSSSLNTHTDCKHVWSLAFSSQDISTPFVTKRRTSVPLNPVWRSSPWISNMVVHLGLVLKTAHNHRHVYSLGFWFLGISGMWVWVCFAICSLDLKAYGKDKREVDSVISVCICECARTRICVNLWQCVCSPQLPQSHMKA